MSRITLQDLAYELNISVSTVSKALKGYPDVSEKTKKAVVELADKLNFSPNIVASNLRTQHTKTIGVIVPEIVHHFFSNVIGGIINIAEQNGYMVILLQSNEKFELEQKQINLLIQQQVDGILMSLTAHTTSFEHIKRVQTRGIPLVMYDKVSKNINCSKVIIDDKQAAYDAVSYLIRKGYKRIAFLGGSLTAQNFNNRFLGYKEALSEFRIKYDESIVYITDSDDEYENGMKYAEKIVSDHSKSKVDALFTVTDLMAVGASKYFNSNEIKIPEDIAIFGFSNWFMSSIVTPSLSTVNQPGYEMGEKSVELLLKEIALKKERQQIEIQRLVIPTSLEIREST
ncbi:LacI family DNA-binding transcriptional regulator [Urechidicola vernalis]|uniref:LacI family DNA-binding transcriptional regulator n=1 Tax=Urechidicola vernalis TaxID=3075600 RepID=A0ABU2Y5T7_9FLAO|nr:LacI family DNA-binding transcriptional regulator [Urechidicola sp. P050]MDT0553567.1 LacI family DNA-binding transcriptional regulator [Urechidicola sp. P050]